MLKRIKNISAMLLVSTLSLTACVHPNTLDRDSITAEIYGDEIKSVYDANKKDTFDEIEYENIKYKIEQVEITKNIGDHKKELIDFWDENIDEHGNLLGNEYYIWINIKVKNAATEKKEILLNNLIANIDSKNIVTETGSEARYIYPEQSGFSIEQSFHCRLEPNEERIVEIGYIIEEKNAHDAVYYCIGDGGGSSLDSPVNNFVYLGELKDDK